jgi:hypothetical protein
MAEISLTLNKNKFRFDEAPGDFPVLNIEGLTNNDATVITDIFRFGYDNGSNVDIVPHLNRTVNLDPKVIDTFVPTLTFGSGVSWLGPTLRKTTADSFSGAYSAPVASGYVSIQAENANVGNLTVGISLQSGAVSYDHFSSPNVENAMVFISSGQLAIYEKGVPIMAVPGGTSAIAFMEYDSDGIVNYYIARYETDYTMELIRSIRSDMAYPITPVYLMFSLNSYLGVPKVGTRYKQAELEEIGVLSGFEDWKNPRRIISTHTPITLKSGRQKFFTFSPLDTLREWEAKLTFRDYIEYLDYLAFYEWHGIQKEFIFRSLAREEERWARFTEPFGDSIDAVNWVDIETSLRQTYRTDNLRIIEII